MPISFHSLELRLFSDFQGRIKIRRKTKPIFIYGRCVFPYLVSHGNVCFHISVSTCQQNITLLSVACYSGQQLIAVVTHFLFHYPQLTLILSLLLIHVQAWEFERAILSKVPSGNCKSVRNLWSPHAPVIVILSASVTITFYPPPLERKKKPNDICIRSDERLTLEMSSF